LSNTIPDIPAGEELLADYGDSYWITMKNNED
jgi:hypothetical protein